MEITQFEIQLLKASLSHNSFKVQPVDVPTAPSCLSVVGVRSDWLFLLLVGPVSDQSAALNSFNQFEQIFLKDALILWLAWRDVWVFAPA